MGSMGIGVTGLGRVAADSGLPCDVRVIAGGLMNDDISEGGLEGVTMGGVGF